MTKSSRLWLIIPMPAATYQLKILGFLVYLRHQSVGWNNLIIRTNRIKQSETPEHFMSRGIAGDLAKSLVDFVHDILEFIVGQRGKVGALWEVETQQD